MPRPNRRRRDLAKPLSSGGGTVTESYAGGEWAVRRLAGTSTRAYLCPGCQHDIATGTAHVVVWPLEGMGSVEDRRHWHTSCWAARDRHHPRGSTR